MEDNTYPPPLTAVAAEFHLTPPTHMFIGL